MPHYTFACQQCGKEVTVYRSSKQTAPRFCSHQCHLNSYAVGQTEHICDYCGNAFMDHAVNNRKFCSQDCYWKSKENKVETTCTHCGKLFHVWPSELSSRNFCSRDCWRLENTGDGNPAWRGGIAELCCTNCKQFFTRPLTWPKSSLSGTVFCGQDCRTEWMRKKPENTPNWKNGATAKQYDIRKSWQYSQWRMQVFRRDNYRCQKCRKRGRRLHAHHLYEFSKYEHLRFSIDNGHTLCKSCHTAIKGKEREYRISLGLPADNPPFQLPLIQPWD